jgi:DNA invertase Pin-like site-specific DNA recombinase
MIFNDTPKHNITNAVIYCRVSSKAQTKRGDGLNSQETRCKQYAQYKGYDVLKSSLTM